MRRSGFWVLFHEVWTEDKSLSFNEDYDYDKNAWMYVQSKIEEYERKHERKRKNVSNTDRRLKDRRS